ncbi:hypothetical protein BKA62DRAFT_769062 [Auriculariales sp. MPI-PUGE-AT-0066]|nr:hypothetical protein BKA62DRAFT_769062 [Auriculariales sp. MPI-PUGE-AT-0066]
MSSASSTYSTTDTSIESAAGWAHLVERLHRVANGQDSLLVPGSSLDAVAPPPPTPGHGFIQKN